MVRAFTHGEPSSFETLGSQFFCTRKLEPNYQTGTLVRSKVRVLWDSGQTQSLSFSGTESPDPDPQEYQICLLVNLTQTLLNILDCVTSRPPLIINHWPLNLNCMFIILHSASEFTAYNNIYGIITLLEIDTVYLNYQIDRYVMHCGFKAFLEI